MRETTALRVSHIRVISRPSLLGHFVVSILRTAHLAITKWHLKQNMIHFSKKTCPRSENIFEKKHTENIISLSFRVAEGSID
jgi:hypothetical protein